MVKVLLITSDHWHHSFTEKIIDSQSDMAVIGRAANWEDAVKLMSKTRPDVILLELILSKREGITAIERIMQINPTPIVVMNSMFQGDPDLSGEMLKAGALAMVEKPPAIRGTSRKPVEKKLIQTLKTMAGIKVVRRWPRENCVQDFAALNQIANHKGNPFKMVVIGASTGGPPVIHTILSKLPHDFSLPILCVQHITSGFLPGFVDWMSQVSGFPCHIAAHNIQALSGNIYFAPDDHHMGVAGGNRIILKKRWGDEKICPSVSFLFDSAARALGPSAVGILLSGMGNDGARELKMMRDSGSLTLVQDESSCVVFGMPDAAIKLNAAEYVLSPEKIAEVLVGLE